MAKEKDFTIHRGDDLYLEITMETPGTVAGWTTQFYMRKKHTDPAIALSVPGAVVDPGSPTTVGVFQVILRQADILTLEAKPYVFAFRRIDPDTCTTLTYGKAQLLPDVEHALT